MCVCVCWGGVWGVWRKLKVQKIKNSNWNFNLILIEDFFFKVKGLIKLISGSCCLPNFPWNFFDETVQICWRNDTLWIYIYIFKLIKGFQSIWNRGVFYIYIFVLRKCKKKKNQKNQKKKIGFLLRSFIYVCSRIRGVLQRVQVMFFYSIIYH